MHFPSFVSLKPNQALLYSSGKFTAAKGQLHKMSLVSGQGTWNMEPKINTQRQVEVAFQGPHQIDMKTGNTGNIKDWYGIRK
jgi:hypothetical protein